MKDKIIIDVIEGSEGQSIYINDYRVSGPKPWGGGKLIKSFSCSSADVCRALKIEEARFTDSQQANDRH